MRNSRLRHNTMALATACTLSVLPAAVATEPFQVSREDVVSVRADTAWEDLAPDTVHFSGHFEMRVRDWRLTAERATVRGRLDDPESVELEGSPARFDLVRSGASGPEAVDAEARRIVYHRDPSLVVLDGDARISQGDSTMYSSHVEYEPDTDRVRATGQTGVRIDVRGTD